MNKKIIYHEKCTAESSYILYEYTIRHSGKKNYGDSKKISGCQGLQGREE